MWGFRVSSGSSMRSGLLARIFILKRCRYTAGWAIPEDLAHMILLKVWELNWTSSGRKGIDAKRNMDRTGDMILGASHRLSNFGSYELHPSTDAHVGLCTLVNAAIQSALVTPDSFRWTSLALNLNTVSAPHSHPGSSGRSRAFAIGEYDGGHFRTKGQSLTSTNGFLNLMARWPMNLGISRDSVCL